MGGEHYTHSGGAANYLCLPKVPKYDQYKDGVQHGGLMYGTEYQLSFNPFDKTLQDHNAACAVCYVESLGSMLMRSEEHLLITRMITDRIGLHSVLLPLLTHKQGLVI